MKIHLKFNHKAETVLESIDCPFDSFEVTDQVNDVVAKFMGDEKYKDKSELAELMHNELDYTIILSLALKQITDDLEKKMMKNILRNILDKDEDI
jgi:hypothetical protein